PQLLPGQIQRWTSAPFLLFLKWGRRTGLQGSFLALETTRRGSGLSFGDLQGGRTEVLFKVMFIWVLLEAWLQPLCPVGSVQPLSLPSRSRKFHKACSGSSFIFLCCWLQACLHFGFL
ncbi:mCG145519, partial [Mus musculus]